MQINWIHGANYASAPSWLGTVLADVATFYDKLFTNNVTIDATVNWVKLGDTASGGILAENELSSGPWGVTSSFATVSAALVSHAQYATQTEAYSNMPSGVGSVYVAPGEAIALGLAANLTVNVSLNIASDGSWVQDGGYFDPFAAIAHEITETAMGRISNPSSTLTPMDMFRFSAPGVHDLTSGTASSNATAYFSVNDGTTKLGTWNNQPNNGDFGDWATGPIPNDAYGSQDGSPVTPISEVDLELMNVLGWSTDVVTSGDTLSIHGGQTSSGFDIMAGGEVIVLSGGATSNFTYTDARQFNDGVLAAGSAGGLAANGLVENGGSEVSAIVAGGGREYVLSGGRAVDAKLLSAGIEAVRFSGSATGTVVSAGGAELVSSGGEASATKVRNGGRAWVLSGGHAVGATVSSGGIELVRASGATTGTVLSAVGEAFVSSGGVASGTTVLSGGRDYLLSGGFAVGLGVASGGALVDEGEVLVSGAAATLAGTLAGSGAVVETGGGDLVIGGAGAGFDGRATIRGGTIELAASGALGSGYVQFVEPSSGSAVLQIDAADAPAAGGTFANTISNFNGAREDIDLRSIAFVAGASAKVSGSTLVLTDGGATYRFKLAGAIAGAYPVLGDGHGGTLIDPTATAPKAIDPRVTHFAQTAAAFAPTEAAKTALASSTAPTGQMPFLHATASASAGHP